MKKLLALLLTAALLLSVCAITVSAAERPEKVLDHDGGSLILTNRGHRCSSPSQDVMDALNEKGAGSYYISAWFRLVEPEDDVAERGVNINFGLQLKTDAYMWKNTKAVKANDGEWHRIEEIMTVSFEGELTEGITYIQSLYADDPSDQYLGDMEWDGMMICPVDGENFGENLLVNGACDYVDGDTEGWSTYQSCDMENSAESAAPTATPEATKAPEATKEPEAGQKTEDGAIVYADGAVPYNDPNIRYMGRWNEGKKLFKAGFESNVSLKFTGTSLKIKGSGSVWVDIDRGDPKQYNLGSGTSIAKNLADGEHLVRIYASAQTTNPSIKGFVLDAGASTLPQKDTKVIEFVGDSIMEGYVNPADKDPVFGNNSSMISYGTKVGMRLNNELGYDFNVIAFGGCGILNTGTDPLVMGERYFKICEKQSGDTAATKVEDWDTSRYTPDYIVLNLGTNDSSSYGTSDQFKTAYKVFLLKLKSTYPNVKLFVMTPFNGGRYTEIKQLVEELKQEDIILIDSAKWKIMGGADNLHPSPASHITAAEKLYDAIKDIVCVVEATPEPTAEPTPAPTDAPATDAPTATDAPAEKKGCGSVLALGLLAAVVPAAVSVKKKED